MRKAGYSYTPVDGFVQHRDIAGYAAYFAKYWLFSDKSKMNSAGISAVLDRYHDSTGALNQTDNILLFDFLTRSRLDIQSLDRVQLCRGEQLHRFDR